MKKLLFLDLDDSVFQTKRKCTTGVSLRPVAYRKDGSPISYCTPKQWDLLAGFFKEMTVIPTTARNIAAFGRVDLPFTDAAIVDYGGVILDPDGSADPAWLARTQRASLCAQQPLATVMQAIIDYTEHHEIPARVRIIEDLGMALYVLVKHEHADNQDLEQIRQACILPHLAASAATLRCHINDNNLSVLPDFLDKRHAVAHLIDAYQCQHGEVMTWGMGDSKSDAGFLALCDYLLLPGPSQLTAQLTAQLASANPNPSTNPGANYG